MLRKLKLPLAISISLVFDLQTAPQGEIFSPVYRERKKFTGEENGDAKEKILGFPSPNQGSEPHPRRPGWDPQSWDTAGA